MSMEQVKRIAEKRAILVVKTDNEGGVVLPNLSLLVLVMFWGLMGL
jgi:hypothetical protein